MEATVFPMEIWLHIFSYSIKISPQEFATVALLCKKAAEFCRKNKEIWVTVHIEPSKNGYEFLSYTKWGNNINGPAESCRIMDAGYSIDVAIRKLYYVNKKVSGPVWEYIKTKEKLDRVYWYYKGDMVNGREHGTFTCIRELNTPISLIDLPYRCECKTCKREWQLFQDRYVEMTRQDVFTGISLIRGRRDYYTLNVNTPNGPMSIGCQT